MIVYGKKLATLTSNIIMFSLKNDDNYLYLDTETFKAISILKSKYRELSDFTKLLDVTANLIHEDTLLSKLPSSLSHLSAFIRLAEEMPEDTPFEKLLGTLHKISNTINMNEYLNTPKEIRKNVFFYVDDDYEVEWTLLMKAWVDVTNLLDLIAEANKIILEKAPMPQYPQMPMMYPNMGMPMQYSQTTPEPAVTEEVKEEEVSLVYLEDEESEEDMMKWFEEGEKETLAAMKEEENEVSAPIVEEKPKEVLAEEEKQNKVNSLLDKLT